MWLRNDKCKICLNVGHEEELRTRRLLKKEQALIVEQLNVEDSKGCKKNSKQSTRANKCNHERRSKTFNKKIQQRDADDMVATALKVDEWNKEGKKQASYSKNCMMGINDAEYYGEEAKGL